MTSKSFSKRLLDEEHKQRDIRRAQITRAIEEAMTTSTGIRRESFNAVDLAVKLKTIDVNDLNNWTYDSTKKTIDELIRSGAIIEKTGECGISTKKGFQDKVMLQNGKMLIA